MIPVNALSPPTLSFPALCFGPGLSPRGEPVSVQIDSDRLRFRPRHGREESVSFENLQLATGGFDHDQIILTWNSGADTASLVVTDSQAKKIFLSNASPLLTPQLLQWKEKVGRVRRRMRIGSAAFILFLLIPLLLPLALWWQSDQIVAWTSDRISIETEQQIGNIIFEEARIQFNLLSEGEALRAIEAMGNQLTEGSPYRFQWHLADDPNVNAVSMPGGHIVVFTGLIRASDSPEEVAGVLAHEIQHVTQRHGLKGLMHTLGWRTILSILLGEVGSGGGPWEEFAAQWGTLRFGRTQETEADLKGLILLKEAEIDPEGMIAFFQKLEREEGPAAVALLSSHPASGDRVKALRAAIERIGPWKPKPLPYDWKKVKASLK